VFGQRQEQRIEKHHRQSDHPVLQHVNRAFARELQEKDQPEGEQDKHHGIFRGARRFLVLIGRGDQLDTKRRRLDLWRAVGPLLGVIAV